MVFTGVVLVLSISACAGPFEQVNFEARESYRSGSLPEQFKADGIALLTATGGGIEYRKLVGDIVEEISIKLRPDLHVIPYWKTLSIINRDGLSSEYAEMLKEYDTTGILNKKVLMKLRDAMGVSYFLQPRLVSFEQTQSTRFSFLGLTMVKTQESRVKLYLELWNAETGEILWIGVGDTNMAMEHYRAKPISFEEVARFAIEKVVAKMPLRAQ